MGVCRARSSRWYNARNSIIVWWEAWELWTPDGYFFGKIWNIVIQNSSELIDWNSVYNTITSPAENITLYARWEAVCEEWEEYSAVTNECYEISKWTIIRDSVSNEIIQVNTQEWDDLELYFISNTWALSHYTIMDRNLWATEVYNQQYVRDASVINTWSFWYHYQWWNNYGFEPCINNPLTGETCIWFANNAWFVNTVSKEKWGLYMPSRYAMNIWSTNNNWMAWSTTIDNIWWWSWDVKTGNSLSMRAYRQWPCPNGYYIPSTYDWLSIRNTRSWAVANGKNGVQFANDLLLPPVGYRGVNKVVRGQGYDGRYWSSSSSSSNWGKALYMRFNSSSVNPQDEENRSNWMSIRCVKETPNITWNLVDVHLNWWSKVVIAFTGTAWSWKIIALWTPTRDSYSIFAWWYSTSWFDSWTELTTWSTVPFNLYAKWDCAEWFINSWDVCVFTQNDNQQWDDLELYFFDSTWALSHYTIMDRNMWATEVYNQQYSTNLSVINTWSFGYYYQWWNNYWFANEWSITTTGTQVPYATWSQYVPSKFTYQVWNTNNTWMASSPANNNIRWWSWDTLTSNWLWTVVDRQWPCPDEYYVPSIYDLINIYNAWSGANTLTSNKWKQFASDLLLPPSWYRSNGTSVNDKGNRWYYWTTSPSSTTNSRYLDLQRSSITTTITSNHRAWYSVRCVKAQTNPEINIHLNWWSKVVIAFTGTAWSWKIIALWTPTKDSYSIFAWWYSTSWFDSWTEVTTWSTVPFNLYAKWDCAQWYAWPDCIAPEYTITFDANWWELQWSNMKVVSYGNTYNDLPTPTREWYTFKWWYARFNGVNEWVNYWREYMYTDKLSIHFSAYMDDRSSYGNNNSYYGPISSDENGWWSVYSYSWNIAIRGYDPDNWRIIGTSNIKWKDLNPWLHDFDIVFDGQYMYGYLDGEKIVESEQFESGNIKYHAKNSIIVWWDAGGSYNSVNNWSYFRGYVWNIIIQNSSELITWSVYNTITTPAQAITLYAIWQDDRCPDNLNYDENLWICYMLNEANTVPAYYGIDMDSSHKYNWNSIWTITIFDPNNPDISLTIMDKNMWAKKVWAKEGSSDDNTIFDAYGYHYQWWNNHPFGMECSGVQWNIKCSNDANFTSGSYSDYAVEYMNYWPWNWYSGEMFIYWSGDYWSGGVHYDNLWWWGQDAIDWTWWWINNGSTRQWPCPEGYHVPSAMEWSTLIQYFALYDGFEIRQHDGNLYSTSWWVAHKYSQNFMKTLKIPYAGYLDENTWLPTRYHLVWNNGAWIEWYSYYLSSSAISGRYMVFITDWYDIALRESSISKAWTLRCFKDSPNAPQILTVTFDEEDGELLWADENWKLTRKVDYWKTIQEPIAPTMDWMAFWKWVENWNEESFSFSTPITSNKSLKAIYGHDINSNGRADEEEVDIITFDSMWWTPVDSQNVPMYSTWVQPEDPIRDNSFFIWWYLSWSSVVFNFTWTQITWDIILYARWGCDSSKWYVESAGKCVHPITIIYHPNQWSFSWMWVDDTIDLQYIPYNTGNFIMTVQFPNRAMTTWWTWYMFDWWYTDLNYTTEWTWYVDETTLSWTVYAKWLEFRDLDLNFGDVRFTIMDRNLWSFQSWTNWANELVRWKYFQWWNNYWFNSVDRTLWNTSSVQMSSNVFWPWNYYSNATFIIGSNSWTLDNNMNLRWGSSIQDFDRQWPCPEGYHIPTSEEWSNIFTAWCNANQEDCQTTNKWVYFSRVLNLPFAWYRDMWSSRLHEDNEQGIYRSSTWLKDNYGIYIDLTSDSFGSGWWRMADGMSIRCFKNTYLELEQPSNENHKRKRNYDVTDIHWSAEKWSDEISKLTMPELDIEKYDADYSLEQNEAYQFSYANWITTNSTMKDAKINWRLTRIAMAKMLSYYAINVLWKKPDDTLYISFRDVSDKLNAEYDNAVLLAYQLWIMWINMPNKRFRPNDYVTRWEFATALSRMIYWIEDWKWKTKYYAPHILKLYNAWIISDTNPNLKERRWYVMLMLMRTVK